MEYLEQRLDSFSNDIRSIVLLKAEKDDPKDTPIWVIPDEGATINIVLDGKANFVSLNGNNFETTSTSLIGPLTQAKQLYPSSDLVMLQLNLSSTGLFSLLKQSVQKHTDTITGMELFQPDDRLKPNSNEINQMMQECIGWAKQNLNCLWNIESTRFASSKLVLRKNYQKRDRSFMGQLSLRQRQRNYKTMVGISRQCTLMNERFLNICLFIQKILTLREVNWIYLIEETGYYDQSQFIRHCRKMTGISPVSLYSSIRSYPLLLDNQKMSL